MTCYDLSGSITTSRSIVVVAVSPPIVCRVPSGEVKPPIYCSPARDPAVPKMHVSSPQLHWLGMQPQAVLILHSDFLLHTLGCKLLHSPAGAGVGAGEGAGVLCARLSPLMHASSPQLHSMGMQPHEVDILQPALLQSLLLAISWHCLPPSPPLGPYAGVGAGVTCARFSSWLSLLP